MQSLRDIAHIEYDSPLEKKVHEKFLYAGIKPKVHYKFGVYTIDFAFPDEKLAIEIDGKKYHETKRQLSRDKAKNTFLENREWRVKRYVGWLAWRHPDLPACDYILNLMKNPTKKQIDIATATLVMINARTLNPEVGETILERYTK